MNSRPLLDQTTFTSLQDILQNDRNFPRPTAGQREALTAFLDEVLVTFDPGELAERVALGDLITLISPADPDDSLDIEIVLPAGADVDHDRIPVTASVSLATLGRVAGNRVHWETPAGRREMTIAAIRKKITVA